MSTERTNQIETAAAVWLIRRDGEDWTQQDQTQLEAWLHASTLHRVAFLRLEQSWEESGRLKALGAGILSDQPPPPGKWNLTPFFDQRTDTAPRDDKLTGTEAPEEPLAERQALRSHVLDLQPILKLRRWRVFALAASLVIGSVGAGFYAYNSGIFARDGYATPLGGLEFVPTADGSNITLNTDSQIRVALSDTERRIELEHGEAYFEVAHDTKRPFVVQAGNRRVIAVGTKFSVRRDRDDNIQVVVTEGKVLLGSEDGPATRGGTEEDPRRPVATDSEPLEVRGGTADLLLTPGTIARASHAGVLVERKSLRDAEERLSWRTGILMFRNQTLSNAVAEFNRYNARKIIIDDPALAELKIEGNFRATNAVAFARLLKSGFPVRVTEEPDRIVITAQ